jgi:hypothetical protein
VGLFGLVIAAAGSLSSIAWGWGVPKPQMRWCVALWLIAAVIAIILSWGRRDLVRYFSLLLEARLTIRGRLVPLRQALGYGVITCLFVAGIAMQLGIGLNNLRQLPESDPDIQAAQWIKAHSTFYCHHGTQRRSRVPLQPTQSDLVSAFERRPVADGGNQKIPCPTGGGRRPRKQLLEAI